MVQAQRTLEEHPHAAMRAQKAVAQVELTTPCSLFSLVLCLMLPRKWQAALSKIKIKVKHRHSKKHQKGPKGITAEEAIAEPASEQPNEPHRNVLERSHSLLNRFNPGEDKEHYQKKREDDLMQTLLWLKLKLLVNLVQHEKPEAVELAWAAWLLEHPEPEARPTQVEAKPHEAATAGKQRSVVPLPPAVEMLTKDDRTPTYSLARKWSKMAHERDAERDNGNGSTVNTINEEEEQTEDQFQAIREREKAKGHAGWSATRERAQLEARVKVREAEEAAAKAEEQRIAAALQARAKAESREQAEAAVKAARLAEVAAAETAEREQEKGQAAWHHAHSSRAMQGATEAEATRVTQALAAQRHHEAKQHWAEAAQAASVLAASATDAAAIAKAKHDWKRATAAAQSAAQVAAAEEARRQEEEAVEREAQRGEEEASEAANAIDKASHWKKVVEQRHERKQQAYEMVLHWRKVHNDCTVAAEAAAQAAELARGRAAQAATEKKATKEATAAELTAHAETARQAAQEAEAEHIRAEELHKQEVAEAEEADQQKEPDKSAAAEAQAQAAAQEGRQRAWNEARRHWRAATEAALVASDIEQRANQRKEASRHWRQASEAAAAATLAHSLEAERLSAGALFRGMVMSGGGWDTEGHWQFDAAASEEGVEEAGGGSAALKEKFITAVRADHSGSSGAARVPAEALTQPVDPMSRFSLDPPTDNVADDVTDGVEEAPCVLETAASCALGDIPSLTAASCPPESHPTPSSIKSPSSSPGKFNADLEAYLQTIHVSKSRTTAVKMIRRASLRWERSHEKQALYTWHAALRADIRFSRFLLVEAANELLAAQDKAASAIQAGLCGVAMRKLASGQVSQDEADAAKRIQATLVAELSRRVALGALSQQDAESASRIQAVVAGDLARSAVAGSLTELQAEAALRIQAGVAGELARKAFAGEMSEAEAAAAMRIQAGMAREQARVFHPFSPNLINFPHFSSILVSISSNIPLMSPGGLNTCPIRG